MARYIMSANSEYLPCLSNCGGGAVVVGWLGGGILCYIVKLTRACVTKYVTLQEVAELFIVCRVKLK